MPRKTASFPSPIYRRAGLLLAVCAGSALVAVGCTGQGAGGAGRWDIGGLFSPHKPKGEPWTILCLEARDRNRVKNAEALIAALQRVPQLDGSQALLSHEERISKIYYGTYYKVVSSDDHREAFGHDLLRDLRTIQSLSAGQTYPFAAARVVPKPTPDVGRPEWHISRCPGDYTLQIGVFYNTATFGKRKASAAEWADQLRGEGIEAYYHHGEVRSSVTVGHFSERDIIREQRGPRSVSVNTLIRYSDRVEALRKQDRFRYNLENGHKVKRIRATPTGMKEVYQESFLIPVPRKKPDAVADR